jgi:hypothetical protein
VSRKVKFVSELLCAPLERKKYGTWFITFEPGRGLVHHGRWSDAKQRATAMAHQCGIFNASVRVAR